MRTATSTRTARRAAAAVLAALALAACGDAAGDTGEAAPATEAPVADTAAATGDTIEVVGVDYGFEGVPATAPVGSTLTFRNDSQAEAHELVLFKVADGEERPVTELLQLGEEEAMEAMTFTGVAFAMPGEEGASPAEGSLTLTEPGRYALVCHFPTGADPEVIAEAMSGELEGKPDFGDGAPHFVEGMVAELTVE